MIGDLFLVNGEVRKECELIVLDMGKLVAHWMALHAPTISRRHWPAMLYREPFLRLLVVVVDFVFFLLKGLMAKRARARARARPSV